MSNESTSEIPVPTNKSLAMYLTFMAGQMISLLGSGIVQFAILWWITITYQNGFYLSLAAVLGFGPTLVVGLFAGVFVDRWNRKVLIGIVDSMEAFVSLGLAYLFWKGMNEKFMLYAIFISLTLRAIFQGFHAPAIQAIIPLMIPRKHLSRVNSAEYLSNGVLNAIGPIIAAVLLGIFGLGNLEYILLIDMGTFLIAVVPLILITIPSVIKRDENGDVEKTPFSQEFKEGFVFIKQKKGLLALLSAFATSNFFSMPLFVLIPLIVVEPSLLNGNAQLLAIAFAGAQLGTIGAALLIMIKNPFSKNTNGVFYSLMVGNSGALMVMIAAITANIPMFVIGMVITGSTLPLANVSSQNIWQTVVPPEKMGRIFAVRRTIAQISSPAAMILTGILVVFTGISELIFASIIAQYLVLLYIYFMTGFKHVEEDLGISKVDTIEIRPTPTESIAS